MWGITNQSKECKGSQSAVNYQQPVNIKGASTRSLARVGWGDRTPESKLFKLATLQKSHFVAKKSEE